MIIVDMGSGNSCRNSWDVIQEMILALMSVDTHKHPIILKWQLFEKSGLNVPLQRELFGKAFRFAWDQGYDTTASVFDQPSLNFLLRFHDQYGLSFIKIANQKASVDLLEIIPEEIRVIRSVGESELFNGNGDCMCCVSKYPAKKLEYEKIFKENQLKQGISDHTTNWELYNKYQPELYEVHFCLDDSKGLDAGLFSRRPKQLAEIL
jgi:sialic acid synthase SpsE